MGLFMDFHCDPRGPDAEFGPDLTMGLRPWLWLLVADCGSVGIVELSNPDGCPLGLRNCTGYAFVTLEPREVRTRLSPREEIWTTLTYDSKSAVSNSPASRGRKHGGTSFDSSIVADFRRLYGILRRSSDSTSLRCVRALPADLRAESTKAWVARDLRSRMRSDSQPLRPV